MNLVTRLLGLVSVPVEHRYNLISLRITGGFGLGGIAEKHGNILNPNLWLFIINCCYAPDRALVGRHFLPGQDLDGSDLYQECA
jgi:hypothetical protein